MISSNHPTNVRWVDTVRARYCPNVDAGYQPTCLIVENHILKTFFRHRNKVSAMNSENHKENNRSERAGPLSIEPQQS